MSVELVQGSKRLLAVTQAVDPEYLDKINSVDWLRRAYEMDEHSRVSSAFRRRILMPCDLQDAVDREIQRLLPIICAVSGQSYEWIASSWQICEPNWVCPMHTDGHKPNVMIIYWQTPGPEFGTTFYNSSDPTDVWHEFAGIPNTGFFANYEPNPGESWPELWHASLQSVPAGSYRLLTRYEFQR